MKVVLFLLFFLLLAVGFFYLSPYKILLGTYRPSCNALQGLVIRYPLGWKASEESIVSDGPTDKNAECMIMFGFPGAPRGRQDAYGPDVQFIYTVKVYQSTFEGQPTYRESQTKETIGGKEFSVIDYSEGLGKIWQNVSADRVTEFDLSENPIQKPNSFWFSLVSIAAKAAISKTQIK